MEHGSGLLVGALVFLVAAVVAAPLARRLGVGVAVGYLIAGVAIGPGLLGLIKEPGAILGVAEIGVVMLLFVIGLELRIERLIALRRYVFGLGAAQILLTAAVIALIGSLLGLSPLGAVAIGFALSTSSTALALQILEDRGHLNRPYGEKTFAVLLAQDIMTVPALAIIPLVGAGGGDHAQSWGGAVLAVGIAAAALAGIVLVGRFLLNPMFRLLAGVGAREVMTAAALLVVLGAAQVAALAGVSMALGAFLAGVLLAGSSYRHELEADVEPFRGLLIALFFMSIGMTLDVGVVLSNAGLLAAGVLFYLALKLGAVVAIARLLGAPLANAIRVGTLLAGASEFSFVLIPLSQTQGLISGELANLLSALAALSLMVAPALIAVADRLIERAEPVVDGPKEDFTDAKGQVLVIGFGRVGQIAAQLLLAEGVETTLIDANPDRVEQASRFGFKVYYGDGGRLDVLRAAGAAEARAIVICVDNRAVTKRIVDIAQKSFPLTKLVVKAYDRGHALELMSAGVEQIVRETFESALLVGRLALEAVGVDPERAAEIEQDVRRRDAQKLEIQKVEGIYAGRDLTYTNRPAPAPTPEPLSEPRRKGRMLDGEPNLGPAAAESAS